MTPAIHRYEVPVDDQWHQLLLSGYVVHVASGGGEVVEVGAVAGARAPRLRSFLVVSTGQGLPEGEWEHRGTALTPGGTFVWHLLEGRG